LRVRFGLFVSGQPVGGLGDGNDFPALAGKQTLIYSDVKSKGKTFHHDDAFKMQWIRLPN